MLKIYGRANSINVQKAMWAVGECGVAYKRIDAGGPFGGIDTPEYLAMNPNGVVPTLDDDGLVLWESNAIVRYVAQSYCDGSLWPSDAKERAHADQWMEWCQSNLYPHFIQLFWALVRTPREQQKADFIAGALGRLNDALMLVDQELSGRRFLAGDALTMGDIPAGATFYRYFKMEIERPELPNVSRWYGEIAQRPAYKDHVMIPFDDLVGRLAF
jgi:glutathione S-transferase